METHYRQLILGFMGPVTHLRSRSMILHMDIFLKLALIVCILINPSSHQVPHHINYQIIM